MYKQIVRQKIAVDKRRPDGRAAEEIRPITSEVSVAPRTHGSAIFTRGQTQMLTLPRSARRASSRRWTALSLDATKRYIHHYNFPPYSMGESGCMRAEAP